MKISMCFFLDSIIHCIDEVGLCQFSEADVANGATEPRYILGQVCQIVIMIMLIPLQCWGWNVGELDQ